MFVFTEVELDRSYRCQNRFGEMDSPLLIGIGCHDGELLAAPAATEVQRPIDALRDRLCHGNQGIIPAIVAVFVIEILEVIDVDEQHADGLRCPHGCLP